MHDTVLAPVVETSASFFLDEIREASWTCIAFVCATEAVAVALFLWSPGVLTMALTWIVCIGLGIFGRARLRPADLGLNVRAIPLSFMYALVWFALTEATLLMLAFLYGLRPERPVFAGNIGPLVDQLLFFALSEEIVFRGFLLAQLYRKLRKLGSSVGLAALAATLIVQVFFALMHIPHRIHEHLPWADFPVNLALTGAFGLLFCLVYLRTGNLLVAVIVHAVSNVPALLPSPLSWRAKNLSLALVALVVAQLYARIFRTDQTTPAR